MPFRSIIFIHLPNIPHSKSQYDTLHPKTPRILSIDESLHALVAGTTLCGAFFLHRWCSTAFVFGCSYQVLSVAGVFGGRLRSFATGHPQHSRCSIIPISHRHPAVSLVSSWSTSCSDCRLRPEIGPTSNIHQLGGVWPLQTLVGSSNPSRDPTIRQSSSVRNVNLESGISVVMLVEGEKYACEACVRGHRVSNCYHSGEHDDSAFCSTKSRSSWEKWLTVGADRPAADAYQ